MFEMGFHTLTMEEIKARCADAFPLSRTRNEICDGLAQIYDLLKAAKVKGTLWIDGSFATKKINPSDADVVLVCEGVDYDTGTSEYRNVIDLMISNLKKTLKCETYVLLTYPPGHALHTEAVWTHGWYLGKWGWSDGLEAKGIVTLEIDGQSL